MKNILIDQTREFNGGLIKHEGLTMLNLPCTLDCRMTTSKEGLRSDLELNL